MKTFEQLLKEGDTYLHMRTCYGCFFYGDPYAREVKSTDTCYGLAIMGEVDGNERICRLYVSKED